LFSIVKSLLWFTSHPFVTASYYSQVPCDLVTFTSLYLVLEYFFLLCCTPANAFFSLKVSLLSVFPGSRGTGQRPLPPAFPDTWASALSIYYHWLLSHSSLSFLRPVTRSAFELAKAPSSMSHIHTWQTIFWLRLGSVNALYKF